MTHSFGAARALRDVSLRLYAGRTVEGFELWDPAKPGALAAHTAVAAVQEVTPCSASVFS
ncbi:hypothetical protein [Streptomyces vilmorinianum]|uniref:hypothetical protein n=1 Tax=Streptomyces vilmorinianum TaxID=3051092 RepID=UPI0010FAEEC4|nr:hypothetical protein [Streptomyces vilmorinianum]